MDVDENIKLITDYIKELYATPGLSEEGRKNLAKFVINHLEDFKKRNQK